MIGGLWSNSNLDDEKGTRGNAVTEIQNSYENVLISIYNEELVAREEELFATHPFFTQMNFDYEDVHLPTTDNLAEDTA